MHSEGPWKANKHFTSELGGVEIWSHGHTIAVSRYLGGTDKAFANAKLIAAAPDLLEALRAALKVHGSGRYSWVSFAEDAIRKATK